MPVELKITGKHDVEAAARRLRTRANKQEIRRKMQRAMKEAADPIANDVRDAARNLPAKSQAHRLRGRIADAVYVDAKVTGEANVEIRVSRRKMGSQAALPQLMNRGSFYHPLYGLPVQILQEGYPQWFEKAVKEKAPEMHAFLQEKVVDRLGHELSHE